MLESLQECTLQSVLPCFFMLFRYKTWWGLCLPIGTIFEGLGFVARIFMTEHPTSMTWVVTSQIFIVCSPAAFLAFNYILCGRLLSMRVGRHHSPVRPERVSTLFVISDVSTFMIQATGSALMSSSSSSNIGQKIWLVGLILQGVSYVLFCTMLVYIHVSIKREQKITGKEDWWTLIYVLYISSFFIIVRCVYRIIESAESNAVAGTGVLMTHEVYFYVLDTLPLFIAIVLYVPYWPGRFMQNQSDVLYMSTPVYQVDSRA